MKVAAESPLFPSRDTQIPRVKIKDHVFGPLTLGTRKEFEVAMLHITVALAVGEDFQRDLRGASRNGNGPLRYSVCKWLQGAFSQPQQQVPCRRV